INLFATDVTSRGQGISSVSHIYNLVILKDTDSYKHRIGRTGRAVIQRIVVKLVIPIEMLNIRQLDDAHGSEMNALHPPHRKEV
ncbi:hypothetical protein EY01_15440, partial [Staphylococcus aureus]|uniref:helicase-related protein n=1 Tax=Staphylococcus aureus TaxID=1280 RepID=UPI00065BAF7A